MDIKIYTQLYEDYYCEYERLATENGYHPDDDFEKIYEMMAEDLDDKGFTDDEIDEILYKHPSKNTIYKFIAYKLLTYDDFYDKDSLLERLLDAKIDTDQLTEDDINNILLQKENIDF